MTLPRQPHHVRLLSWAVLAGHLLPGVGGHAPIVNSDADEQPRDGAADGDEEEFLSVAELAQDRTFARTARA